MLLERKEKWDLGMSSPKTQMMRLLGKPSLSPITSLGANTPYRGGCQERGKACPHRSGQRTDPRDRGLSSREVQTSALLRQALTDSRSLVTGSSCLADPV